LKKIFFNIFSILIIFLLLSLGTWQLVRLQWKQELILEIKKSTNQKARVFQSASNKNFQKVKLEGKLLKQNYFIYRLSEKGKYGFDLLSILQLDSSNLILIKRGWTRKIDNTMKLNNTEERSVFEGVLYPLKAKGLFTPDNSPKENFLYYFDKQKLEHELNNKFYPYILVQDKKDLKFSNLENKQIVTISNNHLQYAVTWFVLAIGIIIAFWFYKRK
jgi:surfeit locus 1 family protein